MRNVIVVHLPSSSVRVCELWVLFNSKGRKIKTCSSLDATVPESQSGSNTSQQAADQSQPGTETNLDDIAHQQSILLQTLQSTEAATGQGRAQ